MPYNSFEHYPMSWKPDREKLTYPYYASLAANLENDIVHGVLAENIMLPPQRELADFLDLSLSTVTKAYKLCEEKGLLYGKVGKGTFVANGWVNKTVIPEGRVGMIEMGHTLPFYEYNVMVSQMALEILKAPNSYTQFEYSYPLGTPRQQEAARRWLSLFGMDVPRENIYMASGGQNALALVLMSLFNSGDKIATDAFTYPNFIGLANMLNIQLVGLKGDENGILPCALEQACKNSKLSGIYLMPACANPTNIVIGSERRNEIAEIIKKHGLILIEDDAYAFLSDSIQQPISAKIPEHSVYINSLSKSLSAGLRVAYMSFPDRMRKQLESAVYNVNMKTSSLNVEIATEMIFSGICQELVIRKKEAALKRNEIFSQYFPEVHSRDIKSAFYKWLHLPKGCTGRTFELMCREKGVNVYGSERFCVNESFDVNAVRMSISSPPGVDVLNKGLEIIREVYDNQSNPEESSYIF